MSAVEADLSKKIKRFREILGDDSCLDDSTLTRAVYSTDASIYRVVPQIVARPREREELIRVIRAALAARLPITGRGAGTSCAGNAVGPGVVIDMARHLNTIYAIDPVSRTALIDPGVVQSQLQIAAKPYGLRFGPDPSTSNRCTIGGMIGNNACGPRAMGYGRTSDNIVELEILTGTGELVTLTNAGVSGGISQQLKALVQANLALIRMQFASFGRQISGYALEHLLPENGFDTANFFAGTEGTLGIVIRAKVRLVADAPVKLTLALGYPTMAQGADDMPVLRQFHPSACEGMDRRLSNLVAERIGAHTVPKLPDGDAWIFIELVGDDKSELLERAHALVAAANCQDGWVVDDEAAAKRLWAIRSDAAGLAGVALDNQAYPGWEDSAVPPERLGAYLRDFEDLLAAHHLHGLPYGHFGDGCLHCRIDFPLTEPDGPERFRAFILAAGDLAAKHGGSMSGEHGDGRARSELLPKMYSPQAIRLFGQVKQIFDPENLLNPGVLVDPLPLDQDIRYSQPPLRIRRPDFAAAVHRCTGVGKCLTDTSTSGNLMCPSFQATHDQRDSTRGRARALQEMINGRLITGGWRAKEVRQALEYCLACKGCRRDCPTGVDMAWFKSNVLDEAYRSRIRPINHYSLGWLPRWSRLVEKLRIGWLANVVLQTPGLKHLVRELAGVDQRRELPRFRTDGQAKRQRFPRSNSARKIAVWVDSFSDCFEGNQLVALLLVLIDAGYDPQVIQPDVCCGLTWITTGQLDGARRHLKNALNILEPIAAEMPIVGMEPSCLAVWRSDAAELLPDDDRVGRVAHQMHTLAEILVDTDGWQAPDLSGTKVIAQPHCHHSSVLGWEADAKVLATTGAEVVKLNGCCGLAGNFGVERGHYDISVKIAENELLPAIRAGGRDAIVLSDGFSCRKQVGDLSDNKALTLAQLLVEARPSSKQS